MSLPPLHFLHAVEAAGRLGSFRAAAEELHLTPSAVSQQIRAVETALGARLFSRTRRTVVLTHEGQLYCDAVRQALRDLTEAGRRARTRGSSRVLRLATVDFLAHEFLIPRFARFQARFPKLELRIETSMKVVELHTSELDAGLRVVRGKPGPRLVAEPIGPVTVTPVCSAEIARRVVAMADLFQETLIEMRGAGDDVWVSSLKRRGVTPPPLRTISFEGYLETLTAAERGLGVAYGLFPMTTEWVRAGRLSVPLKLRHALDGGVFLVFRENDPRHALLTEVAEWLREEYAALPELPEGRLIGEPRRSRAR